VLVPLRGVFETFAAELTPMRGSTRTEKNQ
jgi:hypothetical protein